jgi:hypothetical protein
MRTMPVCFCLFTEHNNDRESEKMQAQIQETPTFKLQTSNTNRKMGARNLKRDLTSSFKMHLHVACMKLEVTKYGA